MDADPPAVAEFDDPDDAAWEVERLALHHIPAAVVPTPGGYRVAAADRDRADVERAVNLLAVCLFWPPLIFRVVRLLARAAPTRLGVVHRAVWLLACGLVAVLAVVLALVVRGWVR